MPVPIISIAQMREWERITWATSRKEAEVIRRVGRAAAELANKLTYPDDLVLILAGKGHNGSDARAASGFLGDRLFETIDVGQPETDFSKLESSLAKKPALIIDGLFGIGLNRPLHDGWIRFINRINESRVPVLSIDVPSGLSADTGLPQGASIRAAMTITVGAPKPGLLRDVAWPYVGRLELASDVGFITCPHRTELQWTLPGDFAGFPPRRGAEKHKGDFGRLAIVAGSMGYHGAAVLAARGAQRAQPGLITLYTHERVYQPVASQLQAIMVNVWTGAPELADDFDGMLIGPGLAAPDLTDEIKQTVRKLWRELPKPLVVDASALDWLPPDAPPQGAVRVITPHPGEAARLLQSTVKDVQADRVKALRTISGKLGNCWVVLKGHQTLIGRSVGPVFVNCSGNPHLAQGGSGDVLAGYISGFLAQQELQSIPEKTIRYAVWQHGATADTLEDRHWVVEDLVAELGKAQK